MLFDTIHHIAINASNYDATKNFYVNKLGFQVIRENARPEKNDIKLDLRLGTQELEIFISDKFPTRPSFPEARGLRHLAFKVASVPDTVAYLATQGIQSEPIRTDDYTGEKMTFFFDPDGLPLEIHE
ncbi:MULTISPECIES: VOC family protein [Weissella]|jgi:Lactoylglutathione lyase and related lyases|uniref:Putative lyase n=1 Tax=Weissella cibaria TaxID=137591 RepID=A0A0D1JN12_9LACO|nr:VOC family protein [Weissella cibaria]ALI32438.1 glyoxalase [Weissella cibaria]KIU22673.1 putative lyase [Weissella cibaria]KIU24093.1 putative lyase [Weissella cibaria]KIU25596.1 putative lyase [Weissella cibaria]MBD1501449.1 VOC family protein [Weissella cibaria]